MACGSPSGGESASSVREAVRLLRRLSGGRSWLQRLDGAKPDYGLFSSRKAFVAPKITVPGAWIESWRGQDWLEPDGQRPDRFRISAAGLAWLRRQLTSGDPFQGQHQVLAAREIELNGARRQAVVNDAESPLSWLRRRKDRNGEPLLTAWQFEAGERLRADFEHGHMTPQMTANLETPASNCRKRRPAPASPADAHNRVIDSRFRVREALIAVGPELADIVFDVCCCLKGLEEEEEARGWPRRSGKLVLQIGLNRLARHYGLLAGADIPGTVSRRLQHWGADGYRPAVDG